MALWTAQEVRSCEKCPTSFSRPGTIKDYVVVYLTGCDMGGESEFILCDVM